MNDGVMVGLRLFKSNLVKVTKIPLHFMSRDLNVFFIKPTIPK